MTEGDAIVLEDVSLSTHGESVLTDINVIAHRGEFLTCLGVPGSGTDALFRVIAGLQIPTSGRVIVDGIDITAGGQSVMELVRRRTLATLFESHNFLPAMSIRDNILLPARLAGTDVTRQELADIVTSLEIDGILDLHAEDVNVVDQMRACLARIFLSGHSIVVCEDPATDLQSSESREVLSLLRSAVRERGITVVMTTTDSFSAVLCDRVILMADGTIRGVIHEPSLQSVFLGLESIGHQVS